jgi:NAD(P)H-nitrite reductase large subunit
MRQVDYLILGGGIAGTSAAEAIRKTDQTGSVVILWDEPETLYSRVMLPDFLRDKVRFEQLFLRKKQDYEEKKIELLSPVTVARLDANAKKVTLTSGEEIAANKVLVATGGRVIKLPLPGGDLAGVTYLRTTENAKQIKELLTNSKEASVIGGGFIGIEYAQTFIKHGLKTTALVREKAFWEPVVGENSGRLLSQLLEKNGVTVKHETEAAEFVGEGRVSSIKLKNGQQVSADLVGVGVGIRLTLDHLQGSGLAINKGVLTNEYLETSLPGIWAAGERGPRAESPVLTWPVQEKNSKRSVPIQSVFLASIFPFLAIRWRTRKRRSLNGAVRKQVNWQEF